MTRRCRDHGRGPRTIKVRTLPVRKPSTWRGPLSTGPDLASLCLLDHLDHLDLSTTSQGVGTDRSVLACRVAEPAEGLEPSCWCTRCGELRLLRVTVLRRLAQVPVGWRPTHLHLTVHRYPRLGYKHVWRQNARSAAARTKPSRALVLQALKSVVDRLGLAQVAADGLAAAARTPLAWSECGLEVAGP